MSSDTSRTKPESAGEAPTAVKVLAWIISLIFLLMLLMIVYESWRMLYSRPRAKEGTPNSEIKPIASPPFPERPKPFDPPQLSDFLPQSPTDADRAAAKELLTQQLAAYELRFKTYQEEVRTYHSQLTAISSFNSNLLKNEEQELNTRKALYQLVIKETLSSAVFKMLAALAAFGLGFEGSRLIINRQRLKMDQPPIGFCQYLFG